MGMQERDILIDGCARAGYPGVCARAGYPGRCPGAGYPDGCAATRYSGRCTFVLSTIEPNFG